MTVKYLKYFPKPLLDDLVEGRWLPVVGAGMSKNAALPPGKSLPLWNELGKLVAEDISDYSYFNALDALSAYEHEFGRPKLIERLSELLLVNESRPGKVHCAFCSIPFDVVCTTNFDFLLERQYELTPRPCTPIVDEEQLSVRVSAASASLLKLHGDLNHPNRLVVTEEDYDGFLSRYPLVATHLSNYLITRTAVLIGYSLDDPDFRQLWQVIGDRLGKSRRMAYTISVGAKEAEVARYNRRGVKVVNLPGSKTKYTEILEAAFEELRDYWRTHVVATSHVTEEGPLRELSLPSDSATRLCFFALPLSALPFYRDRVFPLVRELGLVPVTADDVISPGDNYLAKIDALINRVRLVVVDVSSDFTLAEVRMAMARNAPSKLIIIVEEGAQLPFDIQKFRVVHRPEITSVEIAPFINTLGEWLEEAAQELEPSFSHEPRRLLQAKEYRAAVIAAITYLEASLRERLDLPKSVKGRVISVREMLNIAREQKLLGKYEVKQILEWLRVRNSVVHGSTNVTARAARQIVDGVSEITGQLH